MIFQAVVYFLRYIIMTVFTVITYGRVKYVIAKTVLSVTAFIANFPHYIVKLILESESTIANGTYGNKLIPYEIRVIFY